MLARTNRLTRQRDFARLYQRGERLGSHFFLVRARRNLYQQTRIGVVISTKTAKRAVDRNRHKRQVRAVVRGLLTDLPAGWDILITVRHAVRGQADWPVFREELRKLLKRRFSA